MAINHSLLAKVRGGMPVVVVGPHGHQRDPGAERRQPVEVLVTAAVVGHLQHVDLHPGEVAYTSRAAQTVLSTGGNPLVAKAFDPILGGLACTTAPAGGAFPGVASYSLPAATGSGYTLLGAPQVTADYRVIGAFPYLAARLVDVDPATNTETLVARGIYRMNPRRPDGRQTFELHAGAWHFAAGHVPKLELLGTDLPFSRPSNGVFSVTVSNLQLRLPVHEVPGARGVPKVVTRPATTRLAPRPHDPRG